MVTEVLKTKHTQWDIFFFLLDRHEFVMCQIEGWTAEEEWTDHLSLTSVYESLIPTKFQNVESVQTQQTE